FRMKQYGRSPVPSSLGTMMQQRTARRRACASRPGTIVARTRTRTSVSRIVDSFRWAGARLVAAERPRRNCWKRNMSRAGVYFRPIFAYGRDVLTRRQKEVLDYVSRHIDRHGVAPTLHEIGRHLKLASVATVHKHLRRLEEKGAVRRLTHQSRALSVVPDPESA